MITSAISGLASAATAALSRFAEQHGSAKGTTSIDDCPTYPHHIKVGGGNPPPPPPPFERFLKVDLHPSMPVAFDEPRCGNEPRKLPFPFPPPPPLPGIDGLGAAMR